ncbi:hypothetical protein LBMAG57_36080 [Verrucomicrobiota bacterium]|nr:hypothetical protein LBMAG57_36080 [Verrucomicrobiota bacterium]
MKSLFDLQTESGQLWLDITEHLAAKDAIIAAKDAIIAALTTERDAHAKIIADYIAADDAGKAKMLAEATKTEHEKACDAAQAEADAAQVALDAARAKLDALK